MCSHRAELSADGNPFVQRRAVLSLSRQTDCARRSCKQSTPLWSCARASARGRTSARICWHRSRRSCWTFFSVRWNEVMHVETDRSRSDGFGSTSASCDAVRHGAIVARVSERTMPWTSRAPMWGNPTARIMATVQIRSFQRPHSLVHSAAMPSLPPPPDSPQSSAEAKADSAATASSIPIGRAQAVCGGVRWSRGYCGQQSREGLRRGIAARAAFTSRTRA